MTAHIRCQRKSNVVYYDGSAVRQVIDQLAYSSGIHGSPDRSLIYVSQVRGEELYVYERTPNSGDLALIETVVVGLGSDNVNVDEAGDTRCRL